MRAQARAGARDRRRARSEVEPSCGTWRGERIAHAAHGPEVVVAADRAQLRAQPADVDVHRPSVADVVVAPDPRQQLVTGEDAARMVGEVRKELEFLGSDVHRAAGDAQLMPIAVDLDGPYLQRRDGTPGFWSVPAIAPQDRLDARQKLGA